MIVGGKPRHIGIFPSVESRAGGEVAGVVVSEPSPEAGPEVLDPLHPAINMRVRSGPIVPPFLIQIFTPCLSRS
jgi:hypothetical protein